MWRSTLWIAVEARDDAREALLGEALPRLVEAISLLLLFCIGCRSDDCKRKCYVGLRNGLRVRCWIHQQKRRACKGLSGWGRKEKRGAEHATGE